MIQIKKVGVYSDDRGIFFPLGLHNKWIQSNISISKKYTFRGLHHQKGQTAQSKLITVVRGEILDFVVCLMQGNFGDVQFFRLKPGEQIEIPAGYAHGFLAMEENTIIQYLVDNDYSPSTEISFDWKSVQKVKEIILAEIEDEKNILMSDKDLMGVSLTADYVETQENLPTVSSSR